MEKIKTVFIKVIDFLFAKSPLLKMIIAFVTSLVSLLIYDRTDIKVFGYLFLVLLGYTLIIFLIGVVYAYIINPLKNKKENEKNNIS